MFNYITSTPSSTPSSSVATYAQIWNTRYSTNGVVLRTLKQRLDDQIQSLPAMKQKGVRATIVQATSTWNKNHPQIKKIANLPLVRAEMIPMASILVDVTIQRLLDLDWVCTIIKKFSPFKVQPIHVYEVLPGGDLEHEYPVGTRLYGCWDSQHTAVAMYIIATMCLNENINDVQLPANIYPVASRKDIRENFVSLNSADGKSLLDSIDIFMQMVQGVRIDGNNNPVWEEAELKQQYLEEANLFVTAEKFGNCHLPGAISRMQEISRYTSDIIRKFCMYTTTITVPRPIAPQEIEIMCDFFDTAKRGDGIDYTDSQIVELGNHLHQLFGADFHESSNFWTIVKTAYVNWHAKAYKKVPVKLRPANARMTKNKLYGGAFLIYQLNKTWGHPVPALRSATAFVPDNKDLY